MLTKTRRLLLIEVIAFVGIFYLLVYFRLPLPQYVGHGYMIIFGYILPFWMNGKPKPWAEKIAWLKHQAKSIHIQVFYGIAAAILIMTTYQIAYYLLIQIMAVDVSMGVKNWQYVTPDLLLPFIRRLISVAVCEEIFFRYYLDDRLGSLIHNDIIRLLLAATIFSLVHFGNVLKGGDSAAEIVILVITAIGYPFFYHFVFGFCRTKIKHFTLFSCMVGHFISNVIGQMVVTVRFDFLMS